MIIQILCLYHCNALVSFMKNTSLFLNFPTPFPYRGQIISIIVKNDEGWLAGQHSLVSQLRRVWVSEAFQERHRKDNMAATNWKEPKLLAFCLLSYCK